MPSLLSDEPFPCNWLFILLRISTTVASDLSAITYHITPTPLDSLSVAFRSGRRWAFWSKLSSLFPDLRPPFLFHILSQFKARTLDACNESSLLKPFFSASSPFGLRHCHCYSASSLRDRWVELLYIPIFYGLPFHTPVIREELKNFIVADDDRHGCVSLSFRESFA